MKRSPRDETLKADLREVQACLQPADSKLLRALADERFKAQVCVLPQCCWCYITHYLDSFQARSVNLDSIATRHFCHTLDSVESVITNNSVQSLEAHDALLVKALRVVLASQDHQHWLVCTGFPRGSRCLLSCACSSQCPICRQTGCSFKQSCMQPSAGQLQQRC